MNYIYLVLVFGIAGLHGATIDKSREELSQILQGIKALNDSVEYTTEYLVNSHGYPIETHKIATEDGYFLKLHRIPHGRSGKNMGRVAFLQHGVLSSSSDWCIMGPEKSLAFILADEGYDVWMGNARGNSWCRQHENYTTSDPKFWSFSWHEIATIDLPKMIDYVLEQTGADGVYYTGHSQGTTVYFVMTAALPEYNKKIKVATNLAPIGYMKHMVSPLLRIASKFTNTLDTLLPMIGMNEFLPSNDFIKFVLGDSLCKADSVSEFLCTNSLFAVCGFSRTEMNVTLLPLIMKYAPAGSSVRQIVHYGQEIKSGFFRKYDHGILKNLKVYGRPTPPEYDLSKITANTYLIYSRNDWLSSPTDVERLCSEIGPGCKGKILMSNFQFNHVDYLYGINAPTLVYNKVVSLFARH